MASYGMVACAVRGLPSPLYLRRTASISFFWARVSFLGFSVSRGIVFLDNGLYLLFHLVLPHKGGVSIVGLIGPFLGTDKAALNHLLNHYFKGLAVPLEQSEQQPRQHGKNHQQGRCTVGKIVPGQKIKRSAREKRTAEADQLPLGQPE